MTESIVYLIGAGPGNPELITVRGMQCLSEADVDATVRESRTALLEADGAGLVLRVCYTRNRREIVLRTYTLSGF